MNGRAVQELLDRPRSGVAVSLLAGGAASLLRGVDTNWDLRNYHLYNPWAWLHGRLGFDYAPAQVQSYYSPLLDLPFLALVQSGLPAFAVSFAMGIPFGLAGWFFYRTSRLAVRDAGVEREPLALLAVALIALTGAAGLSQIGSTMNEWATAALVMAALFVVVRAVRTGEGPPLLVPGTAGLLCGVAAGLKLTAAIYAVALLCAYALCFRGRRGHAGATLAFVAATAAGFALAYGYWAFVLWERFGNPFFPYFNDLFRSDWWEPRAFFDTRFRPTTLAGWITLPFGLAARNRLASEAELRDPRLAVLLAFAAVLAVSRVRARASMVGAMPPSIRLLAAFAVASYVAWLVAFTVYRYAIPLELVASLLLVLAMRAAFAGARRRDALVAIVAAAIVLATIPPYWGRSRAHAGRYFEVAVPPVAADSLVLLMSGQPFGYLVPFIESRARVMSPASNFTGPWHDNRLQREMAALIAEARGSIYSIRYLDAVDTAEEATMAAYGLRHTDEPCRPIRSNLEARPLGLCPLVRRP